MNILIVEDRPANLKLLRFILESEGHTVLQAADGVEALAILNRTDMDVIITDILMPRMDGYRLCQEVRKSERLCVIPLIFYTATYTSPGDEKLCLDLGGDKYLRKPASPELVLAAVQEVTESRANRTRRTEEPTDGIEVMKEYSARLVFKLEEKIAELLIQSTAMETAANAIVITDSKGTILKVNPAFTTLSGYAAEEAIGRTPGMLKSGQHDQAFYHDLWQTILSGQTWRGEFINRRKDGSLYYGEQTITPVCVQGGPITHFIGIMNDVTERRQAEEALKLFRNLVDESNDSFEVIDPGTGRFLDANEKGYAELGFSREEFLSLRVTDIDPTVDESEWPKLAEKIRAAGSLSGEGCHQRKDGTTFPIEFNARWVRLDRDYIVAMVRDITERKKLEQQFLRAQRMESIGTLAGGIAHDLNNVLSPIMMSLAVLKMRFPDPGSANLLDIISASAERGADMVRQVLTFARGVEGRRVEVQVRHLIQDIAKIANDTFPKNIQVRTILPHDLWTIVGDSTQIHQVLMNLCVNARDAMPIGGALTITAVNVAFDAHYAALQGEAQPGTYVLLRVEDTGTGMPPEIIEKIFDPFFTTKEPGKGTGLGLSTSLAIIKSHGGFLQVSSEMGKGTRFEIHFPAHLAAATAIVTGAAPEPPRGEGELILVVDDEKSVLIVTQQTLEAFGYRTVLAVDGADAVAVYASRGAEIAAVLTDMSMPVLDGSNAIMVLRKMNADLPIIAASGLPTSELKAELDRSGVKHFLHKPYTAETLLKVLEEVFSTSRTTQQQALDLRGRSG